MSPHPAINMTYEEWTIEEQEEVKKFFNVNQLEMADWPKASDLSNSGMLEAGDSIIDASGENLSLRIAGSEITMDLEGVVSGSGNTIPMTVSMTRAKVLLDEVKDPLGLNDSLYQMQIQRIAIDPKYNQVSKVVVGDGSSINSSGTPSILLNSASFDARLFLRLVHQYTSYDDLSAAQENLQKALEMRRETLKQLVRQNFDRFVNAKNSIDAVYSDMRAKGMNSGEYGMRTASLAVSAALEKAQQVYYPLMKRRSREECIRKRLAVFQEYKAIFGLPAALHQHTLLGEFQRCVHDYRRGRELLLAEPSYSGLKPILDKVWALHVEKAAGELRNNLYDKLNSPVFPYDVQSKIVGYLLELETQPDPILFYFSTKSSLILSQCQNLQDEAVQAINKNIHQPQALELEDHVVALLKDSLKIVQSQVYEQFSNSVYPCVKEWKIIGEAFARLSSHMKDVLLPFAKFTHQLFFEPSALGAGSRPLGFNRIDSVQLKESYPRKLEESIKLIVEAFQSHLDSIFSVVSGREGHIDNAGVGMFYGLRIVRQLGEVFAALFDAAPHPVMLSALKTAFAYALDTILARIWATALVDCRNMGTIEDWKLSGPSGKEFSTALVRGFEAYISYLLSCSLLCRRIFNEVVVDATGLVLVPLGNLELWFTKTFTEFVIEGMYQYVRCDVDTKTEHPADDSQNNVDPVTDFELLDGLRDSFDLLKFNLPARLLIILANVQYLRETGLPALLAKFSEDEGPAAAGMSTGVSADQMVTALGNVEGAVTQLFLQGQIGAIVEPIERNWLQTDFPWTTHNQPLEGFGLSKAIYNSLLALSKVQSLICDISAKDPQSLLRDLTQSLISSLLTSVKRFSGVLGSAGLCQARIDVEFLNQRLVTLITSAAAETLRKIEQILRDEMAGLSRDVNETGPENELASCREQAYRTALSQFFSNWDGPYSNLFVSFQ